MLFSQTFDVKRNGVVEMRKCFSREDKESHWIIYSLEQWQNALSSQSVSKELMQCTADIESLYITGDIEKARSLTWETNCDLRRVLAIASYCGSNAAKISNENLRLFTWKDVLQSLGDTNTNGDLMEQVFPNSSFLINPRLHHVSGILASNHCAHYAFFCTT